MKWRTSVGAATLVASLVLQATATAPMARAQSYDEKMSAQAIFDFGKKLMLEGRYAEACPRLAESLRLDPGVGVMLYLAECFEKTDRPASAWAQFREAEALAARTGDARATVARARADALEAKLPKLTVNAPAQAPDGLKITRDGLALESGMWGIALPIDPGDHKVVAEAPGRRSWSGVVHVDGDAKVVNVPALAPAGASPTESGKAPTAAEAASSGGAGAGGAQRAIGIAVAGAGVLGVAAGVYFLTKRNSLVDDSNADFHCHAASSPTAPGDVCDGYGLGKRSDASSAATASTIAFVAGGVAIVGGVVLYLTAPRGKPIVVTPTAGPGIAGASVRGTF